MLRSIVLVVAGCALAPAIAGCASRAPSIDRLWADLQSEAARTAPLADPDEARAEAQAERARKARELHAAGKLKTAQDHFRAAVILAEAVDRPSLQLADGLGHVAAELGEPRGLRAAAEAIDKLCMLDGRPQRYGTQYVWNEELQAWRLYLVDARTTDEERAAVGVPSYAQLIAAEARLNADLRSRR